MGNTHIEDPRENTVTKYIYNHQCEVYFCPALLNYYPDEKDRDEILKKTDMCMPPDYPITAERKVEVIAYRQRLRDITKGELPRFSRCDYILEFDLSEFPSS